MVKLSGRLLITVVAFAASVASAATPTGHQRYFSSPDVAVNALIAANRDNSPSALLAIFGVEGMKLIHSGDPVEDKRDREIFIAAFAAAHKIQLEGQNRAELIVGTQQWPLPIPLIREPAGWRFDTEAGKEEILNRRIGHNELKVIEVCRAYVQAQREYAAMRINGQDEFARQFNSTPGKHDGLYWPSASSGKLQSPLGPLVAEALAVGYTVHPDGASSRTFHAFYGYYFRILTTQGINASGGAKNYIVNGHMTQGFGLIAYPANFGDSGIMTFIVNQSGIVFEKNLGPETARIVAETSRYDPDLSWHAP